MPVVCGKLDELDMDVVDNCFKKKEQPFFVLFFRGQLLESGKILFLQLVTGQSAGSLSGSVSAHAVGHCKYLSGIGGALFDNEIVFVVCPLQALVGESV
jgi:hypothetical protein